MRARAAMLAKIVRDQHGLLVGLHLECPGCGVPHVFPVDWLPCGETHESPLVAGKPHWAFNGDFEKPILEPSVVAVGAHRCHAYIGCEGAQPGQIFFLGDSTHGLRGQIVYLPEINKNSA